MDNIISINKSINECSKEEIDSLITPDNDGWGLYGLPTIETQGEEGAETYSIARTEEERFNAVKDSMSECLWNFNPDFMAEATGVDEAVFERIRREGDNQFGEAAANSEARAIVDKTCGLDALVQKALATDKNNYGYHISTFNSEEIKLSCGYWAYRQA